MDAMRENEKSLVVELVKLKNLSDDLQKLVNKNEQSMSQVINAGQQKDSLIKSQQKDLAARMKELDILKENEAQMATRIGHLEQELYKLKTLRQETNQQGALALKAGEECCCLNVTGELQDLM